MRVAIALIGGAALFSSAVLSTASAQTLLSNAEVLAFLPGRTLRWCGSTGMSEVFGRGGSYLIGFTSGVQIANRRFPPVIHTGTYQIEHGRVCVNSPKHAGCFYLGRDQIGLFQTSSPRSTSYRRYC
jgi:hypothetical protein